MPKTSLPSAHQIVDFVRKISHKGDEILSLHLGSKLSGTFSGVQFAVCGLAGEIIVTLFDSGAGSAALGFMCRTAWVLSKNGIPVSGIFHKLEAIKRKWQIIFTRDTVEFAFLHGRITYLQNALPSALGIQPIVILRDVLLEMSKKVRIKRRSIDRIIEIIAERIGEQKVRIGVVHAADLVTVQNIAPRAKELFNYQETLDHHRSIFSVAANLDPKAIGIIHFLLNRRKYGGTCANH
jgi:DegV family protein with EDD domain